MNKFIKYFHIEWLVPKEMLCYFLFPGDSSEAFYNLQYTVHSVQCTKYIGQRTKLTLKLTLEHKHRILGSYDML